MEAEAKKFIKELTKQLKDIEFEYKVYTDYTYKSTRHGSLEVDDLYPVEYTVVIKYHKPF